MKRQYSKESVRKKVRGYQWPFVISLFVLVFLYLFPMDAYAAEAVTAFGSEYYVKDEGNGEFPIGIYIRAEETIGNYHLELQYDDTRLRYISGADTEEAGHLVIDGIGAGREVKLFLYFEAVSGGEAGIGFMEAEAYTANGNEMFEITELDYAPININGEDIVGISFRDMLNDIENSADQDMEEDGESETVNTPGTEGDAAETAGTEADVEGQADTSDELEESEQNTGYSSAEEIYEQSVQVTIENNRDRMLQTFIYFVIFLMMVLLLILFIVLISRKIKREKAERENASAKEDAFLFEFDTIPEEEQDEEWQLQVKDDIDKREKSGSNTSEIEFKELPSDEVDIEYIDIDMSDKE